MRYERLQRLNEASGQSLNGGALMWGALLAVRGMSIHVHWLVVAPRYRRGAFFRRRLGSRRQSCLKPPDDRGREIGVVAAKVMAASGTDDFRAG